MCVTVLLSVIPLLMLITNPQVGKGTTLCKLHTNLHQQTHSSFNSSFRPALNTQAQQDFNEAYQWKQRKIPWMFHNSTSCALCISVSSRADLFAQWLSSGKTDSWCGSGATDAIGFTAKRPQHKHWSFQQPCVSFPLCALMQTHFLLREH